MTATKIVKIVSDGQKYWLLWHWEHVLLKTHPLDELLYCSGPFGSTEEAEKAVTLGWTLEPFKPATQY
jgi:hypothetical protein